MNTIDWQGIAVAIREGRFGDVAPEVWNQVANEVESFAPKKVKLEAHTIKKQKIGRPSKPKTV